MTPAAAQTENEKNVSVGLSMHKDGSNWGWGPGAQVVFGVKTTPTVAIAVVGDVAFHKFDGYNSTNFLGGARVIFKGNAKVQPWGQFQFGATRFAADGESETFRTFAPGFGADIPFGARLKFRAQVDFFQINFFGDNENETRLAFSVVIPFGTN